MLVIWLSLWLPLGFASLKLKTAKAPFEWLRIAVAFPKEIQGALPKKGDLSTAAIRAAAVFKRWRPFRPEWNTVLWCDIRGLIYGFLTEEMTYSTWVAPAAQEIDAILQQAREFMEDRLIPQPTDLRMEPAAWRRGVQDGLDDDTPSKNPYKGCYGPQLQAISWDAGWQLGFKLASRA